MRLIFLRRFLGLLWRVFLSVAFCVWLSVSQGDAFAHRAAIGTLALIQLIVTVSVLVYGIVTAPDGKDRRREGFGFEFDQNPRDPTATMPVVHGYPRWTPPLMNDWTVSDNLNSLLPTNHARRYMIFHCGWGGPHGVEGNDLNLWMDDTPLFETVTKESPLHDRELIPAPFSDRRVWAFPKNNVLPESVTIFRSDGATAVHIGDNATSVFIDELKAVPETAVESRIIFTGSGKNNDETIQKVFNNFFGTRPDNRRLGALLPVDGRAPVDMVLKVRLKSSRASFISVDPTLTADDVNKRIKISSSIVTVPSNHWAISTLNDGRTYIYLKWVVADRLDDDEENATFFMAYKIRQRIQIQTTSDGSFRAVFPDDVPGNVTVTASYKTSIFGDGMVMSWRSGARHQLPLNTPGGAIGNRRDLDLELTEFTTRTFTTEDDVHDVILELESGSDGFFDQATHGKNAGDTRAAQRKVRIRFREDDAPNVTTSTLDPSLGFVTVQAPDYKQVFNIRSPGGGSKGKTRWRFSLADMFRARTEVSLNSGSNATGFKLPRRKYVVEVTALDKEGTRYHGPNEPECCGDSIHTKLFWKSATELSYMRLVNPNQTMLMLEFPDQDLVNVTNKIEVQFTGRLVEIPPDATSRRVPTWTRNPVWCAIDLWVTKYIGAGAFYNWERHVNVAEALTAAAWCDGNVTNPDKTVEVRAEYDGVTQEETATMDNVAKIVAGARVIPLQRGGVLGFVIDRDDPPVSPDFTDDDIKISEVELDWSSLEQRPTDLITVFTDENKNFKRHSFRTRVESKDRSARTTQTIDLSGVRRETQAVRVSSFIINGLRLNKENVNILGEGFALWPLEAGDIIRLTSKRLQVTTKLYRVTASGWGSDFLPRVLLAEHQTEEGVVGRIPPDIVKFLPQTTKTIRRLVPTQLQWTPTVEDTPLLVIPRPRTGL